MVTVLMAVRDTPAAMLRQAIASIRQQTLRTLNFSFWMTAANDRTRWRSWSGRQTRGSAWEVRRAGLTRTLNRGSGAGGGRLDRAPGCG